MRNTAPSPRRDRGASEYVLLLAILLVAGMFVFSTISSGTTALTTETARLCQEHARWNAYSGALEAEAAAEREVPAALERVLGAAQASGEVDWSAPVLAGVRFPELTYSFDFSARPGCGADDRAEVSGTIALACPPEQLIKAGVAAGGSAQHFEHYTFTLDLASTGFSAGDARQTARQTGTFFVDVETVPGLVDPASTGSGGIGGSPIVGVSARHWPRALAEPSSLFERTAFDSHPILLASVADTWTLSQGGTPSGTAWSGDPEIVGAPVRLGLPNGNRPYVFYLKGVPPGTTVDATDTATILGYDGWRFSSSYDATTDTYHSGDPGLDARRYGTPRYAVVVVMAPGAVRYYSSAQAGQLPHATLILPDGSRIALQVDPTDISWKPETGSIQDSNGALVPVSGEGSFLVPPNPIHGVRAEIGQGSREPPTASNEIEIGSLQSWNITVDGYWQDLAVSLFGQANSAGRRGPTSVTLASVSGKESSLELSYTGGGSTTIRSSTHTLFGPEGAGSDPVNPPPPCCDPPPPARARRWIIAYKTGTLSFPPASARRQLGDIGH